MSNEYNLRLSPKIGDILYAKAQLDYICFLYDTVNISINHDMYEWRSDGKTRGDLVAYHEFMTGLYSWLFSEKNYHINMDRTEYQHMDWPEIYLSHGIAPVKPCLRYYLKPFAIDLPEDYIVVMTKSVFFDIDKFNLESKPIWNALREKSSKCKLVVMGEREVELCYEKRLHGENYISMYEPIMENIPRENIIDMTVPALGITSTKFSRFQNDCSVIGRAKACVTFGYGGAFCMATSFGKSVSYLNKTIGWVYQIFNNGFADDCLATNDIALWAKTLELA